MARIRSIHPGLFTDDAIMRASPFARWLLVGLLTECDDQGAFQWRPMSLKARVLPADNVDIAALMSELESLNFIRSYEHGGVKLGLVRNFTRFQRPKKPNQVHFIPAEFRTYVGLTPHGSEPEPDKPTTVPHQSPTSTEKSPQREDGGGRRLDEGGRRLDGGKSKQQHPVSARAVPPLLPPELPPPELPLERLCRLLKIDMATLQRRPQFASFPGLFYDWKTKGCDPEKDIWPTIETVLKRGKPITGPSYFEGAIMEARDKRLSAEPSENERWQTRLDGFKAAKFWADDWGPKPNEIGCRVPHELLEGRAA